MSIGIWNELPNELYVIGDIHGDFYALKQSLELTGCVIFDECITNKIVLEAGVDIKLMDGCEYYIKEGKIRWNCEKKNCTIVFAGDLIDRCRNINNYTCNYVVHDEDCDYLILKLLIDLNRLANQYNSNVIIVLGNHEIMNIEGKLSYISKKALQNNSVRIKDITTILKENLHNLYGIVRINNYIICHGGINPNFLEKYSKYFDQENEFIDNYNKYVQNYICNKENNILITDNESPFWDRSNGLNNFENECKLNNKQCNKIFLDNILNIKQNIESIKLIVAHCPQIINKLSTGINLTSCKNFKERIWRIDISMSRAFDNYVSLNYINILLIDAKERFNNNNIDMNFILQFNINRDHIETAVQILKITNINEEVIIGQKSLEYFYRDVFKNNYNLMLLYLLQDIELYYNNNKINNLRELKNMIFNRYYKKGGSAILNYNIKYKPEFLDVTNFFNNIL
jgi:hypothetical protein